MAVAVSGCPKKTQTSSLTDTGGSQTGMGDTGIPAEQQTTERVEQLGTGGPLRDIYFDYDSVELSSQARDTLRTNAEWLRSNPQAKAEVEGHCDERGTPEYNLALGAKRAKSARDYLVSLGVSADRLSTISYGEELPQCRDADESCWGQNRRVHFLVSR
ncbi:MAG: peptidoglycan-associated lipoprotein Pal [Candidatus Binatia bacterium]